MKDVACREQAWCPHVLAAGARLWAVATPTTPHTGTANCSDGDSQVGLHRGKMVAPRQKLDGGWRQRPAAGRRGLDATEDPPIRAAAPPDLLPAAKVGAARACQPVREDIVRTGDGGGGGGGEGVRARR